MTYFLGFTRVGVLALAAFSMLSTTAYADANATLSRLTVKAGSFGYTTSTTTSKSGFAGGVDFIVGKPLPIVPLLISAYGDVIGESNGFGVAARNSGPLYAGVGVGYYNTSVGLSTTCGVGVIGFGGCGPSSGTASGFGGKVFVGALFANRFQLEGAYNKMPEVAGYSTNAVTVTVGVRL